MYHAIRTYGTVEVKLHTSLTSVLGGRWPASRSGRFPAGETSIYIKINRNLSVVSGVEACGQT
jgi:hypothetical protein